MASLKPRGSYAPQLAEEIREYHVRLLNPGKRAKKDMKEEDRPVTKDLQANCLGIDPSEWSKILNNAAMLSKENLFRLISMPWVTAEAAQRWTLLWMANELDYFEIPKRGDGSTYLERTAPKSWKATNKLDHLGDSLLALSNYVPTLGVISQIHNARVKANQKIADVTFRLPEIGPRVAGDDFDRKLENGFAQTIRDYRAKQPINKLATKFAEELVAQELAEHHENLNTLANDDLALMSNADAGMEITDLSGLTEEQVREALVASLGEDVVATISAAELMETVIGLATGFSETGEGGGDNN